MEEDFLRDGAYFPVRQIPVINLVKEVVEAKLVRVTGALPVFPPIIDAQDSNVVFLC